MKLGLTFYIASYGAILSTIVFGWDIAKWIASRARLKIQIEDHSILAYDISNHGPCASTWKSVTITNIGAQTTTLKAVWIVKYCHLFDFVGTKGELPIQNLRNQLPIVLEPGKQWDGYPLGHEDSILTSNSPRTYIMVTHSMSDKPTRFKIKVRNSDKGEK